MALLEAALSLGKVLFDVALVDIRLPGMDGIELLKNQTKSQTPCHHHTGHGTIDSAISAMKSVLDYLTKPRKLSSPN
jgi:DNA-binding NtrC family response regulator